MRAVCLASGLASSTAVAAGLLGIKRAAAVRVQVMAKIASRSSAVGSYSAAAPVATFPFCARGVSAVAQTRRSSLSGDIVVGGARAEPLASSPFSKVLQCATKSTTNLRAS